MNANLYLDTETTGVPGKGMNWASDYMNYPYIVTIAWKIRGVLKEFMIHQEGRKMPADATKVNGITTKMANDPLKTEPASFVYSMLMTDAKDAINIIGHNIYFDTSIIKANVLRTYGVDSVEAKRFEELFHKDKRVDTMRSSQRFMDGKWPKLIDLHTRLFGKGFEAHSAGSDVEACERCYLELKKRKII